jgi:hypothetical protein
MKCKAFAGAAALTFLCLNPALAGDAPTPDWLTSVAGQKLNAVDGSTIQFNTVDKGVSLAVTSPTGDTQKNVFAMMGDKLGTVSDGANGDHLIGFFRTTDNGLEAQFADGHTETLTMNAGGGVSVMLSSAANGKACMSWYPQGHTFSDAERRVAVAEYAQRLGVHDPKIPVISHSCDAPPAQKFAAVAPRPLMKDKIIANDKGLVPIMVRTSVVHAVDGASAAPAVMAPKVVMAAAVVAPKPAPVVSMGTAIEQVSAKSPAEDAAQEPVEPGHGASACLSVDNDGSDFGFRNQCGFSVQFSYCLEKADDPAVTCDAGSRAGNVAANSFAPLLPGVNIKAEDAEHDVRWVGCTGAEGTVVAHLDKTDPPAGRCVRTQAS